MRGKKEILMILAMVTILAVAVEITRSEFVIQLNKFQNTGILDPSENQGSQLDRALFESIPKERYLIVYDEQEHFLKIKENTEKVLDYIKADYKAVEAGKLESIDIEYGTVVMILEDISKVGNIDGLLSYVYNGGNVLFAFRLAASSGFNGVYRKLGIVEHGEFKDVVGIRLLDNVLIKGQGTEITDSRLMLNSSMVVTLEDDCREYAQAVDGTKLLWMKKYGGGSIVYFNGTMLDTSINRGLILGMLSLPVQDFMYPVINSKISFIDDFPAPILEGTHEKISNEFGRTIPRFYRDIWWPDMLELAVKYRMKYTGAAIGTYNRETENVEPESAELNLRDYIFFGRELVAHGGEIGIHGYNHQPLFTGQPADKELGYKPWKDYHTMVDSMGEIVRLSKQAFPGYKFNIYVPPSNILDSLGRDAVLAAQPDIKTICSIYNHSVGGDAYEQELGIAPDGIIEFPRLTSEYLFTDDTRWMTLNAITLHGLSSHFVHPDDVLDSKRTGDMGWTQLYKEYEQFNKFLFDNFRWLRGMTASQGANEMVKYLLCQPRYEKRDTYIKVYCNNYMDDLNFVLRSQREIKSLENCSAKQIDKCLYLIESSKPIFQINFKG